jgi:hypothetical protein
MTPQMPPPHLLTRTFASPAWVSQMPLTSSPDCALAGGAASNAATIATIKPNLQTIEFPKEQACIAANPAGAMPYWQRCTAFAGA